MVNYSRLVLMLLHSILVFLPRFISAFAIHGRHLGRRSNNNILFDPFLVTVSYNSRTDQALFRRLGSASLHSKSLKSQVSSSPAVEVNFSRAQEEERKLLDSIQAYKNSNASSEKPSPASFVSLIDKWLAYPYPERAESILDRMEELYTPSGRIYERIINAWTFRAIEGINQINSEWDESGLVTQGGLVGDYDLGVPEEEKSKKIRRIREEATDCSSRAIRLLNRMEQLYREIGDDFRPALSTYTSVINSISRSSQKDEISLESQRDIIERVRATRDAIYTQFERQRIAVRSVEDVFSVLPRLSNADELYAKLRLDGAQQSPVANRFNFNIIINALAQTGEIWAAQAAEDILDLMMTQVQSVGGQSSSFQQLMPNIETFNGCINAWAHCASTEHQEDVAFRAEAILDKLTMFRSTSKNGTLTNVVPDTVTYNTIIKAYANRSDAKRAESILEHLVSLYQRTGDERLRPDLISYSSVLKAYAKAAAIDPSASKKSEDVLMEMISMQQEAKEASGNKDDYRIVNNWCFNTVSSVNCTLDMALMRTKQTIHLHSYMQVLNAYAVQGAGIRASSLLGLMETMGESDEMLKPDTYSYNTVLKALANSKEKGSVERARQILEKMETRHAEGSIPSNQMQLPTIL
jgi:PPR repeat.